MNCRASCEYKWNYLTANTGQRELRWNDNQNGQKQNCWWCS